MIKRILCAAAVLALASRGGAISESRGQAGPGQTSSDRAQLAQADGNWITLAGTVAELRAIAFILDYGKHTIAIEMDGWDWYSERPGLEIGDKVTVYRSLDDDVFERKSIEASAVYVDKWHTYHYADPADEEGGYYSFPLTAYDRDGKWVNIVGVVTKSTIGRW